jgi:hypothetical protein
MPRNGRPPIMSAVDRITDSSRASRHVRKVPQAVVCNHRVKGPKMYSHPLLPLPSIVAAGSKSASEAASSQCLGSLFEEPNHQQKNYGPDDSVDDFRSYATDEDKSD